MLGAQHTLRRYIPQADTRTHTHLSGIFGIHIPSAGPLLAKLFFVFVFCYTFINSLSLPFGVTRKKIFFCFSVEFPLEFHLFNFVSMLYLHCHTCSYVLFLLCSTIFWDFLVWSAANESKRHSLVVLLAILNIPFFPFSMHTNYHTTSSSKYQGIFRVFHTS